MAFEAKRYSVRYGEQGGRTHARRQYAKVVGAIPGNRITLPRASVSGVSGIVRVVRDHEHIHISHDVWALEAANDEVVAFDWNVTGVTGVAYASYGWVLLSKTTTTKAREELRPMTSRAQRERATRSPEFLCTMALHRHRRPDPHRIAPNGQNASLQLPTLASSVVQTSYAAYLSHLCLGLARGHRCRDNHHSFYGVDPDWDMTTKARSITWPPWSPDAKRKEAMPPPDSKQATWVCFGHWRQT
ncbi:hypothetical protein AB6A68_05230 [Ferrimicrobium acidiphilum]|uniref:Transposase n=2 Tax=Ferrimicrobium acidiphilum TaxID=121039 RepID=A0ABV3Y155_9ACTN